MPLKSVAIFFHFIIKGHLNDKVKLIIFMIDDRK